MTETQPFDEFSSRSAAALAEKYLALWNEPDADLRRQLIDELWTEDGRHVLQPPQEIRAIAAKGGVIGIWPNGEALPALRDMVDHIDYVKNLVGVDHVGIGSDLRGMSSYTEGFGEEARFDAITEALGERGYSPEEVEKVMGGNFVRVWTEVTR